jgi:hypothetical protein
VLAFQSMIVVQPLGIDERRARAAVFRDESFTAFGADNFAELRQLCSGVTKRDDVFGCNCHEVFWPSGSCDFEARHFGGDTPEL